jgi:hypothetical protein
MKTAAFVVGRSPFSFTAVGDKKVRVAFVENESHPMREAFEFEGLKELGRPKSPN